MLISPCSHFRYNGRGIVAQIEEKVQAGSARKVLVDTQFIRIFVGRSKHKVGGHNVMADRSILKTKQTTSKNKKALQYMF